MILKAFVWISLALGLVACSNEGSYQFLNKGVNLAPRGTGGAEISGSTELLPVQPFAASGYRGYMMVSPTETKVTVSNGYVIEQKIEF